MPPPKKPGWEYKESSVDSAASPSDVLPWAELPYERSGVFRLDDGSVIWSWFNAQDRDPRCCFHELDWCCYGLVGAARCCVRPWRQDRQEFLFLKLEESGNVAAVHAQPHHHKWPACCGSGTYFREFSADGVAHEGSNIVVSTTSGRVLEVPLQHQMAIDPPLHETGWNGDKKDLTIAGSTKADFMIEGARKFAYMAISSFADVKNGASTVNIGQFKARDEADSVSPFGWHPVSWEEWNSLKKQCGLSGDPTSVVLKSRDENYDDDEDISWPFIVCGIFLALSVSFCPCTPAGCCGIEAAAAGKKQVYQLHAKEQEGVELILTEKPIFTSCTCCRTDKLSQPRAQRGYSVTSVETLTDKNSKLCGFVIHTAQAAAFHVKGKHAVQAIDEVKRLLLFCSEPVIPNLESEGDEKDKPMEKEMTRTSRWTRIVEHEEVEPLVSQSNLPSHWTNTKLDPWSHFDQMVYVDSSLHKDFEELLQNSYVAKVTQDRPCPKAKCDKKPGGCPCNQPGGDPGLPVGYQVCRVIRIEDSKMWQRYVQRRDHIKAKRTGEARSLKRFDPPLLTEAGLTKKPEVFASLDPDINECYVWHGTNVRAALSIAQDDFNINLAGDSSGTMYGNGLYAAESSTKADEYSSDEPGGYYDGVFAMLLCRACMGKIYYTTDRNTEAEDKFKSGEYDSTLGDRAKSVGTFRELVLYNNSQIYPEYIVMYKRAFKGDIAVPEAPVAPKVWGVELDFKGVELDFKFDFGKGGHTSAGDASWYSYITSTWMKQVMAIGDDDQQADGSPLFHMEVPVYWRNCHRNICTDPFKNQIFVHTATIELLQRLVRGCSKENPRIVSAKRIEHSAMWLDYVRYKEGLRVKLSSEKGTKFANAEELDDNWTNGQVLTDQILKQFPTERCMSFENIESALNEHLLWHGSSKDAVDSIVDTDFKIPIESEVSGKRFGQGAYFAERFDKSLAYADAEPNGRRWVLLCRVACGDYYYTQAENPDAHVQCQQAGKDSVLANPDGKGPREFTIQTPKAVYPEFCLEFAAEGEGEGEVGI